MPLKYKLKPAEHEAQPEETKKLYVKRGEVYVLDADGAEDAERIAEFRNTNIELLKLVGAATPEEAKTKLAALKDVDPARYKELMEKAEKEEQERLKREGKLEEAYKAQIAALTNAHKTELEKTTGEVGKLKNRLETILIDDAIVTAAAKKGVKPTALVDVKARGRQVFKLENDAAVAYKPDGKPDFDEKEGKPLTVEAWLDRLLAEAPHLFEGSKGGGSQGDPTAASGSSAGAEPNPYKKETLNLTKQAKLERENPTKAALLKAAAGVK